jgi:hypothetical protein
VFLAAAMAGHLDIEIRHVLPALPFLYLFICFQLTGAGGKGVAFLGLLIAVAIIESAWIAPQLCGVLQPDRGWTGSGCAVPHRQQYRLWSGHRRLAGWLHSDPTRLGAELFPPVIHVPRQELVSRAWTGPAAQFRDSVGGGLLAISKNVRYGLGVWWSEDWLDRPKPGYGWLSEYPIVKQICYSIDVYELDAPFDDALADDQTLCFPFLPVVRDEQMLSRELPPAVETGNNSAGVCAHGR